jgi:hypothetical protein
VAPAAGGGYAWRSRSAPFSRGRRRERRGDFLGSQSGACAARSEREAQSRLPGPLVICLGCRSATQDHRAGAVVPSERDEIVAAARAGARSGLTAATVRRGGDFLLPGLAAKLDGWVRELSAGRAFVLIRGFPVDVLSEAETELAYVGLGLHLGTPVSQNAAGDLLGHIRGTRVVRDSPAVRLYTTSQRQDFHCDGSDLVGLLCLEDRQDGRGEQDRLLDGGVQRDAGSPA